MRATAYENATRELARRVGEIATPDEFKPKYDMVDMVYKFRAAFKSPDLRKSVLSSKYESQRVQNAQFSAGFCGMASYAWNHIFRMPDGDEVWKLKQVFNLYKTHGIPNHVWLESVVDGQVLDLTFDQFTDSHGAIIKFPYEMGVAASADFEFQRGYLFGNAIDVNLREIAFVNALKSIDRK